MTFQILGFAFLALILVRALLCLRLPVHPETVTQPVGEDFAKWLGRWKERNKESSDAN